MNAICEWVKQYGPLVARILLAQLFIVSGIGKIGGFAGTAAFMSGAGVPAAPALLVVIIALEIGGSLMLIAGWQVRWAAAAFCVFILLASVVVHPFWNSDAASFLSQMNNFMKNFAIMGGMLYVMAYGAGPFSVDNARATGATGTDQSGKKRSRHD
ncbi:MAG: DoxX protein [Betaproteobacteria bacterium]|nr:DoxX protein [Betaproteobacteria bacterium]